MWEEDDNKVKKLPSNESEWNQDATNFGVLSQSICHMKDLKSSSKIKYDQYLCLRVLQKPVQTHRFHAKEFELDEWLKKAREELEERNPSWKTYLDNFNHPDDFLHGAFSVATLTQRQVLQTKESDEVSQSVQFTPVSSNTRLQQQQRALLETPSKSTGVAEIPESPSPPSTTSTYPFMSPDPVQQQAGPSEDEQIVNIALLNFIQPLTMFAGLSNEWTIHRLIMKVQFGKSHCEARTDGYLRDKASKRVRALIEVKAAVRGKNIQPIVMQESAAMSNWITQDPKTTGRPGR